MWRNDMKCKYMFMFPLKNLARKGLLGNGGLQGLSGHQWEYNTKHIKSLVTPYGDIDLGQHRPRQWLVTRRHYMDQCWFFISEVLWQSHGSNSTATVMATILENKFAIYTSEIIAISPWGQWVNIMPLTYHHINISSNLPLLVPYHSIIVNFKLPFLSSVVSIFNYFWSSIYIIQTVRYSRRDSL